MFLISGSNKKNILTFKELCSKVISSLFEKMFRKFLNKSSLQKLIIFLNSDLKNKQLNAYTTARLAGFVLYYLKTAVSQQM